LNLFPRYRKRTKWLTEEERYGTTKKRKQCIDDHR